MKTMMRAIAVVAAVLVSGCATYDKIKPAPVQSKPISVVFSNESASGWTDLPIGAYRVPNSSIIVTGHQKAGAGIFFGLVGVLASDAIDSSRGASKVKGEKDTLQVDLVPQTSALTEAALGKFGETFAAKPVAGGPTLTVTPYIVVTFATDTKVRTHVVLKTELKSGQPGAKGWTSRYLSSMGPSMLLEGDGSLTANKGELLKSMLAKNLERAVSIMLEDIATRPVRDDKAMTYVEAGFPFLRPPFAVKGYMLADKSDYIVYAPKFADATVLGGVYALDKSVIVYHPATDKDEFKLLDEEK